MWVSSMAHILSYGWRKSQSFGSAPWLIYFLTAGVGANHLGRLWLLYFCTETVVVRTVLQIFFYKLSWEVGHVFEFIVLTF